MRATAINLPESVKWDDLPDVLGPVHLKAVFGIRCTSTISNLVAVGQLPRPCISMGNIRRWRKEDVREALDRRMRMG